MAFYTILVQLIYLMLPAYVANMVPVFARKLPVLNRPIDAGMTWRGRRILGANKTWRGIVVGVIAGVIVAGIQWSLVEVLPWLNIISYEQWYLVGILLSLGALLGDALKSFLKRRVGIQSGTAWIPFDQIDYAIGAVALLSVYVFVGWINIGIIILTSLLLHLLTNLIGYFLKIRKQPW